MNPTQLLQLLTNFSNAWNKHDVEALMACMHHDCCFETVAGSEVFGTRIQGFDAVKQAFENTFQSFPDAQWLNGKHWLSDDAQFGISETTFTATAPDGGHIEANAGVARVAVETKIASVVRKGSRQPVRAA